ncbi:MAG: DUF4417 domain-containing protein [Mangrovibacterium sp.]
MDKHNPISIVYRKISDLSLLDHNPRKIKKSDLEKLADSLKISPAFFEARPLILSDRTGKLVVIAGNQRLKAAKMAGMTEAPTYLMSGLTEDQEKEIILRDNISNGEWDFEALTNDDTWANFDFDFVGLEIPDLGDKKKKGKKGEGEGGEDDEDTKAKKDFFLSQLNDCLYESNNEYEIPNLLLEKQAGKLLLPLAPWGADSRIRKGISTYHFYVDDYRFEAIFKDPVKVLTSGVRALVEPNLSLYDTTPIAYGLQLIYKKRWISRYFQECNIMVYVDLNVSRKFREFNKMGVPAGYNAFFTRGYSDRIEYLEDELQVAREISGKDVPNLIVYGGGDEVKKFCIGQSLVYVEQFINDDNHGKNKRK